MLLELAPRLILSARAYDLRAASIAGVSTELQLSFVAVAGALSYEFRLSTTSATTGFGAWNQLAVNKKLIFLTASTQYWVQVRTVNGVARGPASPVATATTNAGALLTIAQTGSVIQIDAPGAPGGLATTGTLSTTITVPSDATLVLVGVNTHSTTANAVSGGTMTFTKGGVDTTMTSVVTGANGGDNNTAVMSLAMFYLVNPDTGTNKTLKWNWLAATDLLGIFGITFWKGVDTTSPVRHALGAQTSNWPVTTGTLTCVTGDKIVAMAGMYNSSGSEGVGVSAWSNLTLLQQLLRWGSVQQQDGALATANPTGNTTVGVTSGVGNSTGIVAAVLKPGTA